MADFSQLETLSAEIEAKASASPDSSYTAKLISKGIEKCAKKLGEEAVELALAAVQQNRSETAKEAADVLYHLLVLLKAAGVSPDAVMDELRRRQGTSGLVEKASRKDD
jgi:phosphoribosyl-ATP pyrophosphohydrolase